jgi:hypothetical protein
MSIEEMLSLSFNNSCFICSKSVYSQNVHKNGVRMSYLGNDADPGARKKGLIFLLKAYVSGDKSRVNEWQSFFSLFNPMTWSYNVALFQT